MKLKFYIVFIVTLTLCYSCNSSDKTKKDDAFIFIERNAYTTNNFNDLEYYRLNKATYFNNISPCYALMILYIGKDGTNFDSIDIKMKQLLDIFSKKVSQ